MQQLAAISRSAHAKMTHAKPSLTNEPSRSHTFSAALTVTVSGVAAPTTAAASSIRAAMSPSEHAAG